MKKTLFLLCCGSLGVIWSAVAEPAPKPLFRDPVHDGAADPVVVWNPQVKRWWMFYTNRRANITNEPGVAWVHGTRLGIAESANGGVNWNYLGTAQIELPEEYGGNTNVSHWAPEIFTAPDGEHHMFLTVVPGVFKDWDHPRHIMHLTSRDLRKWSHAQPLKLATDRVIDACALRIGAGTNQIWRLWYNNERDRKSIYYADSPDLVHWQDKGKAVGDQSGEGPKVFRWQNSYWMVTDVWRGLGVYRSDDAQNWQRQSGGNLLQQPGVGQDDQVIGGHPDVVVSGDRAFLFYFTHPGRRAGGPKETYEQQRSSILVTELFYQDGKLTCDRDKVTDIALLPPGGTAGRGAFKANIHVEMAQPIGAWPEVWRFFGADEPNYAYMKNGKKLLGELGRLKPKQVYFRTHNLLCTGDGTPALKWGSTGVYREDTQGNAIYDWTILDRIFDTYRDNGVRPFAQIGFMPEALSIKPQPYQHSWTPAARYEEIMTGWAYPPKDYDKWRELVYQWVKHCVERYGREEVAQWYWEVWNEANGHYWKAKPEEFHKLHDYAIDGVRRALPEARVGGPDSAGSGGQWTRNFLEHCLRGTNYATGKIGTPIDFVAFHAKGSPVFTNGHVRMGISSQLRAVNDGFKIVASYPDLKPKPIVIGESDPEGCAACQGEQLGYRNGTMYSSYTAASFARKIELGRRHGVNFEGALTWAFTFEEQPLFAGFRQIATGGIDMPVLNVFRMFSQMEGQQLRVTSDAAVSLDDMMKGGVRGQPDVGAQATLRGDKLCVLAWHYHDDDVAGETADVEVSLNSLPKQFAGARVTRYVIDQEYSNSYTAWQKMGSPSQPTPEQYAQLEQSGKLAAVPQPVSIRIGEAGAGVMQFKLPRQAVTLIVLEARKD